jgi:hypothetical protein
MANPGPEWFRRRYRDIAAREGPQPPFPVMYPDWAGAEWRTGGVSMRPVTVALPPLRATVNVDESLWPARWANSTQRRGRGSLHLSEAGFSISGYLW